MYIPIMAQYVEPGMESPMGKIKDVNDDGDLIRVDFEGNFHVMYDLERPLLIAIDLEENAMTNWAEFSGGYEYFQITEIELVDNIEEAKKAQA